MTTIKIGSSDTCDIKFYGKDITSSVWATISASDKKMLVLKMMANNNKYNATILNAMKRYKVAKSTEKSLYGIVDDKGNVIVDFLYDEIRNIEEFCWPGPGPLSPRDNFFIGAFLRQGEDAGYLIINEDGGMNEYKRCANIEFISHSQLS